MPATDGAILSLTILLRSPEGIVMAADSRVTEGYTLQGPKTRDDSVKFIQLNNDFGVMTHGLYDIGIKGINALKGETCSNGCQVSNLPEFVADAQKVFTQANIEWSGNNPDVKRKDNDTGFVVGGFDRQEMSFKVYSFESPEFTPKLIASNFFMAGQWQVARFLITKLDNRKQDVNGLKNLAAVLLTATMEVDKTVGGPVRLASITESKGFQWVDDEEMKRILDFNMAFCKYFHELLQKSLSAVS